MALKDDIVAKISELSVLVDQIPVGDPQIEQLQAQIVQLQSDLDAANSAKNQALAALQAETSLEQDKEAQVSALQAKIATALSALQA